MWAYGCVTTPHGVAEMLALLHAALAWAPATRPWMDRADPPSARAVALLKAMTLDEKLALFHGSCGGPSGMSGYVGNVCENTRLGIPALKMNDGPQGFRDNEHLGSTTAWPCSLAIGATFDAEAAREWGAGMGAEFYGKGANVQLGPGMCLARIPRNGRNFEYLSGEDPHLGYVLVPPVVRGIQAQFRVRGRVAPSPVPSPAPSPGPCPDRSPDPNPSPSPGPSPDPGPNPNQAQGVIANAKHWVNNNQETARMSVSEVVDERTQFELYYPPFEAAVEASVGSLRVRVRAS